MPITPISDELASLLLLGGSAVAGYAGSRAAVDALVGEDDPAPVKRAVIHATMTAMLSVAALLHRVPLLDVAVGVPFSASVAALTLGLGVVLFVVPLEKGAEVILRAPNAHRAWAFLLPTGLLALLIGFTGHLAERNGLMLAGEGAAILAVVVGSDRNAVSIVASDTGDQRTALKHHAGASAVAQLVVAAALAMVAAWGMVQGAGGLALSDAAFGPGVAAVLALAPAIVLPMIPALAMLAERGERDDATTTIVAFVLMNLCVVVPLIVVLRPLLQFAAATTEPATAADLPFPLLVWRLDTVLISTIGLLLLPAGTGRWALSRAEGFALIVLYVMYLFLTLLISRGG